MLGLIALWQIPNLKIFIILVSLADNIPGETQAHADRVTDWNVVLIELHKWEAVMVLAIHLIEFTLLAHGLLVVFDATLESSAGAALVMLRVAEIPFLILFFNNWAHLHSLKKEVMLVIVWYDLHSKLYLFESISNNFVISSTSFIGTSVLSSRSFFDELLHSLLNIGVSFLFWRSHHASFNMGDHEENERH